MSRTELLTHLKTLKPQLAEEFHLTALALFGSHAKQEATEKSDIDLLFTVDDPEFDLFHYMEMKSFLEKELGKPVDLVQEHTVKPHYRPSIEESRIEI